MNRLFSKIGVAIVGMAMAIGVGVAAGLNNDVKIANAATGSGTFVIGWGSATGSAGTFENFEANNGTATIRSGVTISFSSAKNDSSGAPSYNSSNKEVRFYYAANQNGGSMTFSFSNGLSISNFSFSCTTEITAKYSADGGALKTASKTGNSSPWTYSVNAEDTSFAASSSLTIQNANSANVQLKLKTISFTYSYTISDSPSAVLSENEITVGKLQNNTFTVTVSNLTGQLSVSSGNTNYVEILSILDGESHVPSNPTSDGVYTVTIRGIEVPNPQSPIAITVSSANDSISLTVQATVENLPIIDTNLKTLTWGTTSYATSPHILTMNSSYQWLLSSGQSNSPGFLGPNGVSVSDDGWTLKGSPIDTAIVNDNEASWLTYGSSFYMSNFGVIHPTSFSVNPGTVGKIGDTRKWYILASTNSGDSWSVVARGNDIQASTPMTWSGDDYSSVATPVLFAFVMTHTANKTISDISVQSYGDSLEIVTKGVVRTFTTKYLHMYDYDQELHVGQAGAGTCITYYLPAKGAFNSLSADAKNCFRHLGGYSSLADTFENERARYEAWAIANDDGAPYDGNNDIQTHLKVSYNFVPSNIEGESAMAIIISVIAIVSLTAIGGYFFIRRRKHD